MTTDTITKDGAIYAGTSDSGDQWLRLKFANRHGLIAGATGTGKTITLQGMAEGFSQSGVPVFMADIKGDLSGLAEKGGDNEKAKQRAEKIGFAADNTACPVMFWD